RSQGLGGLVPTLRLGTHCTRGSASPERHGPPQLPSIFFLFFVSPPAQKLALSYRARYARSFPMSVKTSSRDSIFLSAIEITAPEEREAFVAQACGDDETLRQNVQQLIAAHFHAGSFLESPVMELGTTEQFTPGAATLREEAAAERSGMSIGPYKLL